MTPQELVTGLARAIRDVVRPRLGEGREVLGVTPSGDASFALDHLAEEATAAFLAEAGVPVAVLTEDRGLQGPADAPWLLVVDPIDGTRAAKAGLESCCVSVALAEHRPGATLGDVQHAAVYELKHDRLFTASRGEGARIVEQGRLCQPSPSPRTDLSEAASSIDFIGRAFVPVAVVLEELVDAGSLRGGSFCFASTTFALTRLVLGQLDYHVDVAARLLHEVPSLEPRMRRAGHGHIIGLSAYDLAAAVLIAQEAGVVVTDAAGRPLERAPLTAIGAAWHLDCVAAGNAALHHAVLESITRGVRRWVTEWETRDERG